MKKLIRSVVSLVLVGALIVPAVASASPAATTESIDLNLPRTAYQQRAHEEAMAARQSHGITSTQKGVIIGVAVTGGAVVRYLLVRAFIDATKLKSPSSGPGTSGFPLLG